MIDITKPLQFKESDKHLTFIRLVGTLTDGSIIIEVIIDTDTLKPSMMRFNSDGELYGHTDNSIKLINVPEPPMEFWINLYDGVTSCFAHRSEVEANNAVGNGFIKCALVREVKDE